MDKVKIPDSLSASSWNAVNKDIKNDKTLSSKVDGAKMTAAVNALDSAYSKIDFGAGDTKGLTAATAAGALAAFDKAVNAAVKSASDAATAAGKAASDVAAAADKASKEKGASKETIKAAASAKNTLASGVKDASAFASALSAAVDAARAELEAACKNLAKQGEKKAAAPPAKANPKALADAKFLSALMRKSIALLRTPKGSPLPIKFMVLFNKANPKELKLYLGPKPESGLAKLKTQFAPDVKVTRVKDPKGKVVWEKGALTFLSDILKAGLAKQVQLAIRAQTKVTVKVRIKRSDGAVDEADARDVSDDELKVSPDEEAEMNAGGDEWEAGLKELDGAIQAARKGPNGAAIDKLVASIKSAGGAKKYDVAADGLNELQSLLEEGDVGDSDGKDLEAESTENKDVVADLKAQLNAIPAQVAANKALKKESATLIGTLQKAGLAELGKPKPSLDSAKKALEKIEDLLGAADVSNFPVAAVQKAKADWLSKRQAAITGITQLSRKINEAFAADTAQKGDVVKALKKLGQLQIKLQTRLDNDLDLAMKAKNLNQQKERVASVRESLSSLRDFMQKDELIMNIDSHDVPGVPSLTVVKDMLTSLRAIETALPQ
jgi:hypothetical protein